MKKLIITIISIILALGIALSVFFIVKCSNEEEKENPNDNTIGLHDISFEIDSSKEFIKNGKTNYVLVVSANANQKDNDAKNEFQRFFREATGYNIATITDSDVTTHGANQKYISLGFTKLFNDAKEKGLISYDAVQISGDGVRLKTVDDNIYILGGASDGNIYATYTFFEHVFNYEHYYVDCYEIDKNVTELNLPIFDITEAPDVKFRGAMLGTSRMYGTTIQDNYGEDVKMAGWRLRTPYGYWTQNKGVPMYQIDSDGSYKVTTEKSYNVHNSYETIGYDYASGMDVFGEEYPEWRTRGGDICFNAGGQGAVAEKKADDLCKVAALRFMQTFMTFDPQYRNTPYYRVMNLTQEDGASACTCNKCIANANKYGAYSSNYILAFNKIVTYMEEILSEISKDETAKATPVDLNVYRERWGLNSKYDFTLYSSIGDVDVVVEKSYNDFYRDDWAVTFFAYSYSQDAPAVKDENGNYVAVAPEMNIKDHIIVWFASNNSPTYDYNAPYEKKEIYYQRQEAWGQLSTAGYSLWNYATSSAEGEIPFHYVTGFTPEHYQTLVKTNCQQAFIEIKNASAAGDIDYGRWYKLLSYIDAKLMWNCNLDYNTLIKNFFNAMYKDGASEMYKMWDSMREYAAVKEDGRDYGQWSGSAGTRMNDWELQPALEWLDMAENALDKIEYLKQSDPEAYQSTRKHILTEWCSPAYICLNWYKDKLTLDKQKDMREKLTEAISYGVRLEDLLARVS